MAPQERSSGRLPGGTESNISERLFNVLNNESYSNQLMAGATGQNQSMADATDYLKAIQMNDIRELLYHNESHVINQMIDQATEMSEKAKPFQRTETVGGQEILLPLKKRSMQWFQIFPHQNQSTIRT